MQVLVMLLVRTATLVVMSAVGISLSGCYRYATVDVTVLDGAGSPLPGVQVTPVYLRFLELFPPDLSTARTNMAGVARLQICYDYKSDYAGLMFNEDIEMQYPYDNYLVPEQTGGSPLPLPVDVLRKQGDVPFAITVKLISIAEYRAKR